MSVSKGQCKTSTTLSCTSLPADPKVVSFSLTKVRAVTLVQNLKSIVERSSNEAIDRDEVIVVQVLFIATVHAHNKTAHTAVCVCLLYLSEIGNCGYWNRKRGNYFCAL